ncbi:MAG: hypothetical protein Kow0077_08260 [Anaerolineae bacterium]
MPVEWDAEAFAARAAQEILNDSSLRDELTDEEAQPLLDWALARIEALAAQASGASPEALEDALANLRRVMKRMNRLVRLRQEGDPEALATELNRLGQLGARLTGQESALGEHAAPELALDVLEGLDTVQLITHVLARIATSTAAPQPAPPTEAIAPPTEVPESPADTPAAPSTGLSGWEWMRPPEALADDNSDFDTIDDGDDSLR